MESIREEGNEGIVGLRVWKRIEDCICIIVQWKFEGLTFLILIS